MASKPTLFPKYVSKDVDRYGTIRFYFRKAGVPKKRLVGVPGTAEFAKSYDAACSEYCVESEKRNKRIGIKLPRSSMVYFVAAGKFVKIGVAIDVKKRISTLQTSSPVKLRLIHRRYGDINLERELHRRFATDHVEGEWFRLSADIKSWIEWDTERQQNVPPQWDGCDPT